MPYTHRAYIVYLVRRDAYGNKYEKPLFSSKMFTLDEAKNRIRTNKAKYKKFGSLEHKHVGNFR